MLMYTRKKETTHLIYLKIDFLIFQSAKGNHNFGFGFEEKDFLS